MDLLVFYLNQWHTLLTNFALEGKLEAAIFSVISNNKSNPYITQLNNQLKVASYESLPKIEIINSSSQIKSAAYSSRNETVYLNQNWLKSVLAGKRKKKLKNKNSIWGAKSVQLFAPLFTPLFLN